MFLRATIPILLLFTILLSHGSLQAQPLSPYQVKAAFLYNFLKFVEWPPESFPTDQAPYVIGVLGKDPFGSILESTMQNKVVNGRTIVIVRVNETEMQNCHLLFIAASERRRYREILAQLGSLPVLTVGETEDFADNGGTIGFFTEGSRLRFEINPNGARRAKLRINSNLLSLAKIVPGR